MTADDARTLALSFPEAVEADHHGRPSFRVGGKIFATLWSPTELNVMVADPGGTASRGGCSPVYWGKKLAAVRVDLERADAALVEELLADAWSRKAPRRLLSR